MGSAFLEVAGLGGGKRQGNFGWVSMVLESGSIPLFSAWSCFGMVFLKETQEKLKLIRVEHVTGPVDLLFNLLK